MNPKSSATHTSADREIVISRLLDAPRELVFRMFVEAEHLSQWWGPRGYTNPVCELDVRPGGTWRNVMRSPDGVEIPTTFVYREIVAPERIVYSSYNSAGPAPGALTTLTFDDHNGKTLLTISSVFSSAADRDVTARMGHVEGVNQSLDRLAAVLTGRRSKVEGHEPISSELGI